VGGRSLRAAGYFTIDAWGLLEEAVANAEGDQAPRLVLNRLRIYRPGVCEWAHRYSRAVREPHDIPSTSFAQGVHNALVYFASVYAAVGYAGRLALFVRIDNAEKATLAVNPRLVDFPTRGAPAIEAINAYNETTVDSLLTDPLSHVRDAMQVIWQAFGYNRCLLFDADGDWVAHG
jgi:hypothetical protein